MLKYYSPQSIERISKLHRLIQEEITGTPRELAFKFNVSERTIYLMIDWLKDYGATIKYDRKRKTYFYFKSFDININFSIECISEESMIKINGGAFEFPCKDISGNTIFFTPLLILKFLIMKTFNLESSGIRVLTVQELKTINGGVKWWQVVLFGIGGSLFGEAVTGAYESGFDAGSQNCQ